MTGEPVGATEDELLPPGGRAIWVALADTKLLHQCEVDTYRASGPGGQKRNKTSSAVRLRHTASGLLVIAEESRSQHENRARALRRLRKAIYLNLRELPPAGPKIAGGLLALDCQGIGPLLDRNARLSLGVKDPRFWPVVGLTLDVLRSAEARVADAAAALGITTGNLIDFLRVESKVWEQANRLRIRYGQKPLR